MQSESDKKVVELGATSALAWGLLNADMSVVQAALRSGADPSSPKVVGALCYAAYRDRRHLFAAALNAGASVNAVFKGRAVIERIIEGNALACARLAMPGLDMGRRNANGLSPLQVAQASGKEEITQMIRQEIALREARALAAQLPQAEGLPQRDPARAPRI